jgi:hypothetical protein
MAQFPNITASQVVVLKTKRRTSDVLDENFEIFKANGHQKMFVVFDSLEAANEYINQFKFIYKNVEFSILDNYQNTIGGFVRKWDKQTLPDKYFADYPADLNDAKSWIRVPIADCLLVETNILDTGTIIAIIENDDFLILLENCVIGTKEKRPLTTDCIKTAEYVDCPVKSLYELPYSSIAEAMADTHWSPQLNKHYREIDYLAHYNNVNSFAPYDDDDTL